MASLTAIFDGCTRVRRMSGWLLVAVAMMILSTGCESEEFDVPEESSLATRPAEIMNGTLYDNSPNWRGVVRIELWSYGEWDTCSGQVVSSRTILTAGHCVRFALDTISYKANPGWIMVRAWRPSPQGDLEVMSPRWARAEYHPGWGSGDHKHDIGLITSLSNFSNIAEVDAAKIGTVLTDPGVWRTRYTFGFGYHDNQSGVLDQLGRSATVNVYYNPGKGEYLYYALNGSQPYVCAGDSGGPLKDNSAWGSNPSMVHGVFARRGPHSHYCEPDGHWVPTATHMDWMRGKISGNCWQYRNYYQCW